MQSVNVQIASKYVIPRITLDSQLNTLKRDFTILLHSMATSEELKSVWKVYKGKGIEFRNIVPLVPERVILHELAAVMQCEIKQETDPSTGEGTFKKFVHEAYVQLKNLPSYTETVDKMALDYKLLGKFIWSFILDGNPNDLTNEEQASVTIFMEIARANRQVFSESDQAGAITGIQWRLYMERARQHANKLVLTALVNLPKLPVLLNKTETVAIFTVGGPASGKTSSLIKIAKSIDAEYNVKWEDMAHHNLDRSRTILLETGNDPINYGNLTSDEARLVRERELKLMSNLSASGKQHHQLYDASEIDTAAFQQSAQYRKATIVCLVSTDFETALGRAYLRGIKEGRYVPIDAFLRSHKNGPSSLINALNHDKVDGTNTTVLMYDNNVRSGEDSVLFGTINAQSKEIRIHDGTKLASWLKKCNLNGAMTFPAEYDETTEYSVPLYIGQEITMEEYFAPLLNRGYMLTVEPELVSQVKFELY